MPSLRHPGHGPGRPLRRRRVTAAILALVTMASSAWDATAAQADTNAGFTPAAAWTDQNGNPLQMHGLGILKVGNTWYAYGEDKVGENSSDATFRAVPCYSSTNLSTWTYQGEALTEQSSGDLGPNRIVERPKVVYNSSTGEYVMWMHIDNTAYTQAEAGVAESKTPCGPYTYLGASQPLGQLSRDIGLFQDSDGTAYLLSEDRDNGLRIDKLSSDYLSVVSAGSANGGSVAILPDYEAPALVKANGVYFVLGSHLSGWATNDNEYATATSLSGTWSSFRYFAPAGTSTYNTQTANIIPVTGSSGTTYIFAGDRWNSSDLGDSPLVWLPLTLSGTTAAVSWQNTWNLDITTGLWTGSSNPANATHYLSNGNSGLVMDVNGGSTATGASIIQWSNHGGTNQQWKLTSQGWNVYTLTNVDSGLCLDVPANSAASGVQLDQWTCNGGDNQKWALSSVGSYTSGSDQSYALTSLESGQVVDVSGASTAAGGTVIQWPGDGGSNQTWNLQ